MGPIRVKAADIAIRLRYGSNPHGLAISAHPVDSGDHVREAKLVGGMRIAGAGMDKAYAQARTGAPPDDLGLGMPQSRLP